MTCATDYRLDDTTAATVVLREAKSAYDVATSNYWQQRELGGIVESDGTEPGVKYVAATHAGAAVLAAWQRARAELNAAMTIRRREVERRR